MVRARTTTVRRSSGGILGVATLIASMLGCTDPPVDTQQPTVTGIIAGSITYLGRRVDCDYVDGVPARARGHVLLTLVDVANQLPPAGTATQPADFLALGAEDVFTNLAADCLPEPSNPPDPLADAAARAVSVTRTANFRWSSVPMGSAIGVAEREADGSFSQATLDAHAIHYTIQGFYDEEGDFDPLFSIGQSTSAGDIAGAALKDPLNADPVLSARFLDIRFESVSAEPNGTLRDNVSVTLAAPVLTDPPIFRVQNGAISAEAKLPFPPTTYGNYPRIDLTLYERTAAGNDARSRLDVVAAASNRADYTDFTNPLSYAW